MSSLEDVILGRSTRTRDLDERNPFTLAEGRVRSVTTTGMVFTVPDWDGGRHEFGPAPWPHHLMTGPYEGSKPPWPFWSDPPPKASDGGHAQMSGSGVHLHNPHTHELVPPASGDRCLVVFLGTGVDRPWVIGWWPS